MSGFDDSLVDDGTRSDNRRMIGNWTKSIRRAAVLALSAAAAVGVAQVGVAQADDAAVLPVFVPYPSDWSPDYSQRPYNMWASRVTPEQVIAERDACQWFNAQYGILSGQIFGFQQLLNSGYDSWSAPGVQGLANVVRANVEQSAAFLDPRAHTLFIINYPDQSEYSPLLHGDSFYRLWFQLTKIGERIAQQRPSGELNANTATMNVYGNAIRDSGVCNGA